MIFDAGNKAEDIALVTPEKYNDYEINICEAATALIEWEYGNAKYLTQYSSGNTLWDIEGKTARYVKRTGKIEFD
jgi:endo-1,4-beta-mannosidase